MPARRHDPRRLDVEAFARDAAVLEGAWPVALLQRLAACAHTDAPPSADAMARWHARGERRARLGADPETWLFIEAQAPITLVCQRCLGPIAVDIDADRAFRFVRDEAVAAELDADAEEDVLALTRWLDLIDLIEDELLLALPIVPRHVACPEPLDTTQADQAAAEEEVRRPFAVLAALKTPPADA